MYSTMRCRTLVGALHTSEVVHCILCFLGPPSPHQKYAHGRTYRPQTATYSSSCQTHHTTPHHIITTRRLGVSENSGTWDVQVTMLPYYPRCDRLLDAAERYLYVNEVEADEIRVGPQSRRLDGPYSVLLGPSERRRGAYGGWRMDDRTEAYLPHNRGQEHAVAVYP